ncbi:MAG TPA: AAA family ATPase [Candidatus Bathyarchaeia archaeon]|nr:AAA family ATPase [Candidatus Bathyarchaeia archaeon]
MTQVTPLKGKKPGDTEAKKGIIITISGPHGTGKSTYARALAKALELRYVCAGELFRELAHEKTMTLEVFSKYAANNPEVDKLIDERTREEARGGGVVIDAQLGAWVLKNDADLKLLLVASDEIRFNRIAGRERVSFETAKRETLAREQIQRDRYKKYYGIDVTDHTIYDLKIDTGLQSIEKTKAMIIEAVRRSLAKKES